MQVFKFGGASVSSPERILNVCKIVRSFPAQKMVVVISAMGKTTNALEKVAEAFYEGKKELALELLSSIREHHLATAKVVLGKSYDHTIAQLANFFTEVEWLLHDKPVRPFDYYYDQIVCIGELLSTSIVSACLQETGIRNHWVDIRDIFRTDDNFREASIDWEFTEGLIQKSVIPILDSEDIIITQGFIGATDANESTTLGREGSDYSAAVFANMLNAETVTIWKDVEGVMNADPKKFEDATLISELNYKEVIEMAYYGAQVIHPKTIKPLHNKSIPLRVKCFLDPALPGTVIHNKNVKHLPPIIVLKEKQVLIQFNSKDFSFVEEHGAGKLSQLLEEVKIRPNLTQNGAISLAYCVDDQPERIEKIAIAAGDIFDVEIERGLTMLTIRHDKENLLNQLVDGRHVVLKQQSRDTVQVVMR